MATNQRELYSQASVSVVPTFVPEHDAVQPGIFAADAGATELAVGTPLLFNKATGFWNVWTVGSEVTTITADSTAATAGTFTLTVDGVTTGTIAYNATAAAVKAALVAANACDAEDVTVTCTEANLGVNDAVMTLTWSGALANDALAVSADFGSLTGNPHVLAEATAGVDYSGGVEGIVYPNAVQLHATNEVNGNIMLAGTVPYASVQLPSGESQADLKIALQNAETRKRGLKVVGIEGVQ